MVKWEMSAYRSLWLAASLLASAGSVQAEPITFVFEGTVESVFDGLGVLDDSVAPGARFVGAYTFDSDTANTAPPLDEGEPGLYHHNAPPAGVHVRIGNRPALGSPWFNPDQAILEQIRRFARSFGASARTSTRFVALVRPRSE